MFSVIQIAEISISVLLSAAIIFIINKYRRAIAAYVIGITDGIRAFLSGRSKVFQVGSGDFCWVRLENEIGRLLEMGRNQKIYMDKRQKQMEKFIENIVHQIKTPLAGIMLNLDLLENKFANTLIKDCEGETRNTHDCHDDASADVDGDKKTRGSRELVSDCIAQGEKIKGHISRLLNLARMEAGKIHFRRERVDMKGLLEEIRSEFGRENVQIFYSNTEMHENLNEAEAAVIQGDHDWLYEAVYNIVDNGIKHGNTGTGIEITLVSLHEEIKLKIRDYGDGIDTESIGHLFERYYVGDNADDYSTGIGLNLAKCVVENHYGEIRAESTAGAETMIEIRLPKVFLREKFPQTA